MTAWEGMLLGREWCAKMLVHTHFSQTTTAAYYDKTLRYLGTR